MTCVGRLIVALWAVINGGAQAQELGNVEQGLRLARAECSECHLVGESGGSFHQSRCTDFYTRCQRHRHDEYRAHCCTTNLARDNAKCHHQGQRSWRSCCLHPELKRWQLTFRHHPQKNQEAFFKPMLPDFPFNWAARRRLMSLSWALTRSMT